MQLRHTLGLFILLFSFQGIAAEKSKAQIPEGVTHIIEVGASTREQRSAVADLGYALEEIRSDKVFIYGNKKDVELLKKTGLQVSADEVQARWFQIDEALEWRYSSYDQVLERMNALVAAAPDLVSLYSIGQTHEGRDIVAIRIGASTLTEAQINGVPQMVYMGCHHAREHMSVEVPLMFAEYLVNNYATNDEIARLVNSRETFIIPVLNVDGHKHDYTDGVRGQMWRKNRRQNANGSFGVDLNRNYGYKWGTGGSSTSPGSDTYMGTEPFSEPETAAVRDFLSGLDRLKATLDFHSFSELILYPWGYTYDRVGETDGTLEDRQVFEKMGATMAQWNNYTPQTGSDLYIASGTLFDWGYGELGLMSFTFELSPRSMWEGGFYPNPNTIPQAFQDNINPMLYMLEMADDPTRALREEAPSFLTTPAKSGLPIASFKDLSL
ncbi:zinc carboxypeptidase [bacterium]|nr:zinc carboxypeptidase [bacterium]